jgi:surfeit locus 1 family protein
VDYLVKAGQRFSWQQGLILLVALASIAITASLGAWQMRRAAYKEQIAEQISKQNQLPALINSALSAPDFIASTATPHESEPAWLQRRAQLQGRWLHAHTVFLDNRPMQLQGSQRVGFYVATPLALEGNQQVIWVQRGWVQRDFQDRVRLPVLPENNEIVTVPGRLIAHVSKAYEVKAAQAAVSPSAASRPSRIWQNLPSVDFGSQTLLPMALLQTAPEAGPDLLQRDWPAADTGVAKHHGYAFQWFALSALLVILYVWFQIIVPRRRAHAQHPHD